MAGTENTPKRSSDKRKSVNKEMVEEKPVTLGEMLTMLKDKLPEKYTILEKVGGVVVVAGPGLGRGKKFVYLRPGANG